ncbi:hypothetical protein PYW08_006065 [Mythimna loreyi]|uniref:Uncharacterized protein n=1 Tax=Mythimna loreyi TaxID=667449 RepID=A0ACC2QQK6_9NEOP|nr:hypothetical protein PYW08_006065 [Mythimna loreyi]
MVPRVHRRIRHKKKNNTLKTLKKLTFDRHKIERSTILQSDSSGELEIRNKLITASNFRPICKRKVKSDTAPLVKNLLYVTSIKHGVEHEQQQPLQQLQQQKNITIELCSLFIIKD